MFDKELANQCKIGQNDNNTLLPECHSNALPTEQPPLVMKDIMTHNQKLNDEKTTVVKT